MGKATATAGPPSLRLGTGKGRCRVSSEPLGGGTRGRESCVSPFTQPAPWLTRSSPPRLVLPPATAHEAASQLPSTLTHQSTFFSSRAQNCRGHTNPASPHSAVQLRVLGRGPFLTTSFALPVGPCSSQPESVPLVGGGGAARPRVQPIPLHPPTRRCPMRRSILVGRGGWHSSTGPIESFDYTARGMVAHSNCNIDRTSTNPRPIDTGFSNSKSRGIERSASIRHSLAVLPHGSTPAARPLATASLRARRVNTPLGYASAIFCGR